MCPPETEFQNWQETNQEAPIGTKPAHIGPSLEHVMGQAQNQTENPNPNKQPPKTVSPQPKSANQLPPIAASNHHQRSPTTIIAALTTPKTPTSATNCNY